jgi:glycosyltransferase involved in cell wall biosynthesis
MVSSFASDPYPGRPKILFVGLPENSHTHSWIGLLDGAEFNVRLFARPTGVPPDDWRVRTYVTSFTHPPLDPETRACLHPRARALRFAKIRAARYFASTAFDDLEARWLARIIRRWRPHVVHTLGLEQGGEIYYQARRKYGLEGIGKWVLQTRGGSDLSLAQYDPERRAAVAEMLRACDQLLCDNAENFRIARSMGVAERQLSRIGPVPGTGGVDVEALARAWRGAPSSRRVILWPKAYETPWAKAMPGFEALRLCWERIRPCEVRMLTLHPEMKMWFWTLPAEIRESCRTYGRLTREEVLRMMPEARVMFAPSLVDGTPNSMLEAMASGALPIVSPLDTIRPLVEHERNVLFARNLYPEEIAGALTRAMTDDALVDAAAEKNLELVRRFADRREVGRRVVGLYEELAAEGEASGSGR